MAEDLFDIGGKVAVVTGGGGILCGSMSRALGSRGVKVAVLDLRQDAADRVADDIVRAGGEAKGFACDVLSRESIEAACGEVIEAYGRIDVLVNGAGGNNPKATTSKDRLDPSDCEAAVEGMRTFFDLDPEGVQFVFNLNILGTLLPTQVFGRAMTESGGGVILNVSSMNAFRPLTRIPAYSAAKAGVSNFTQWLATHFSPVNIRVNAIAPGFFLTDQNRFLLTEEATGALTARGNTILSHTPMGRFGDPSDLHGAMVWLVSDASSFVTGIVVPVDGGFSAFSGV